MTKTLSIVGLFILGLAAHSSAWACSKECQEKCDAAKDKGAHCDKGCEHHKKSGKCDHEKCTDEHCEHEAAKKK